MGAKPIGERICMDCDALAVAGSMRCAPCRDKAEIERRASRRERANIRYQKSGPKKRKLSGTCCDCGKAVRAESVRCLPCSLVFVGQRRAQRAAESAAVRSERVAKAKADRMAKAEAKRAKAEKAAALRMEYESPAPRVVAQRQPVLPYAYRNIRPGSMSEALRIDTGVRHESH